MSSSQVVSLLGSPNLVTSTKDGGEAWTYDKISQESESSSVSELEQVQAVIFSVFLVEVVQNHQTLVKILL